MVSGEKMSVCDRLEIVEANISSACEKSGRRRDEVRLVAVTKASELQAVIKAVELGLVDLGENRMPHFKQVFEATSTYYGSIGKPNPTRWHMIGHLQRNKAKNFLPYMQVLHSLESIDLAERLDNLLEDANRKLEVFVQVNCSKEPQKYGISPEMTPDFAGKLCEFKNLVPVGIMTMAAFDASDAQVHNTFSLARHTLETVLPAMTSEKAAGFNRLSMGMTNDYQIAIQEGATDIRIGSAIFS